jgi:tripartite-type tricarboxylate transporter receptor subunit TctC
VRIIAPSATGSAADTLARVIAQPLAERLGQPVLVDTRPGAGTILGTEAVAKSPPDGHTLLIALPALAINPSIYPTLPYDALRDFTPVTQAISQANLFVVHPSLPAKSARELCVTLQGADIGAFSAISVSHDDAGNGPGWFLDSIAVKKGAQTLKTLSFNQWVYTGTTVTRS